MTEDHLEQEALGWLADVGYTPIYGPELAPDGDRPERQNDLRELSDETLKKIAHEPTENLRQNLSVDW